MPMTRLERMPAARSAIGRRSVAVLLGAVLTAGMPVIAGAPAHATDAPAPAPTSSPAPSPTTATPTDAGATAAPAKPRTYSLGERKLRRGDRGRDVKKLQKLLRVKRTGKFTKSTRKAVKRVQRRAGLKANGVVNKKTLKAVKREYRSSKASRGRAGSPARSKAYARSYISKKYGWGSTQMSCLASLWQRESGWRYWVSNPNGIYRGIPQTSSRVWRPLGYSTAKYMSSPEVQIKVGTHYIKGRYGTPCRAWSFWKSRHWY